MRGASPSQGGLAHGALGQGPAAGCRAPRAPRRATANGQLATDQARAWLSQDRDLVVLSPGGPNGCSERPPRHWPRPPAGGPHGAHSGGGGGPLEALPAGDERRGAPGSSSGPPGPSHSAAHGLNGSSGQPLQAQQPRPQPEAASSTSSSGPASGRAPGDSDGGGIDSSTQEQPQPQHHNQQQRRHRPHQQQQQQQQQKQRRRRQPERAEGRHSERRRPRLNDWGPRLTGFIQSADSWQELAAILSDAEAQSRGAGGDGTSSSSGTSSSGGGGGGSGGGGRLNHIHACALLARTARITAYHSLPPQELEAFHAFFCSALDLSFGCLPGCGPREVATVLWAVARLGLHPGTPWLSAYLSAARDGGQLAAAAPRDAANVLWALARFGHAPRGEALAQLAAAAVGGGQQARQQQDGQQQEGQQRQDGEKQQQRQGGDRTVAGGAQQQQQQQQQQQRRPCAQALSNSIWALATLRLAPPRGWLAEWLAAAGGVLRDFTPQGLANSLWALARLGVAPDDAWLASACAAAGRQLAAGQPKAGEVAMLLHALGRLRAEPPHDLPRAAQAAMLAGGGLGRLPYADAANALWGLAVLGAPLEPAWRDACLARLAAVARGADAQALSMSLYALVRTRAAPPPEWWDSIWEALPAALGEAQGPARGSAAAVAGAAAAPQRASPKSLAVLTLCLGRLRAPRPPLEAASALLGALAGALRGGRLNGTELSNVAAGLLLLQLVPSSAWLEAFDACLVRALPRTSPREAATAARALARLRHAPSGALRGGVEALLRGEGGELAPLDAAQLRGALQAWDDQAAARQAARQRQQLEQEQQQQQQAGAPAAEAAGVIAAVTASSSANGSSSSNSSNGSSNDSSSSSGAGHSAANSTGALVGSMGGLPQGELQLASG
ncbi:hypothetical protein Rsub_10775 [Raphidocelis subcapitata]|uniref:Uncharacterized protein n=1 Tax=Raphidocelis subcapitata TaxID=307507 RepID=A0A2V0PKH8_9CHLO|nr:hypothetical protein Rsub_10775 [Raphidocelis subcapitata]|eukprot:GBF98380.1 hypothetical protein Rsub_10775 [Raphidocelis subcapitata]